MNFSFWPFLWFGLPGRLQRIANDSKTCEGELRKTVSPKLLFFSQKERKEASLHCEAHEESKGRRTWDQNH